MYLFKKYLDLNSKLPAPLIHYDYCILGDTFCNFFNINANLSLLMIWVGFNLLWTLPLIIYQSLMIYKGVTTNEYINRNRYTHIKYNRIGTSKSLFGNCREFWGSNISSSSPYKPINNRGQAFNDISLDILD